MLIARLLALDPEDANEMELPNCAGDAPRTVGTSMPALLTVSVCSHGVGVVRSSRSHPEGGQDIQDTQ